MCDIKEFAKAGIGVYTYFFYLKYTMVMFFLLVCLGAIPQISVSLFYNRELVNYCPNPVPVERSEHCSALPEEISDTFYKTTFNSYEHYIEIADDLSIEVDGPRYDVISFILYCFLVGINMVYIVLFHNLTLEADIENITPSDYTLMISKVPRDFETVQNLSEKVLEMVFF